MHVKDVLTEGDFDAAKRIFGLPLKQQIDTIRKHCSVLSRQESALKAKALDLLTKGIVTDVEPDYPHVTIYFDGSDPVLDLFVSSENKQAVKYVEALATRIQKIRRQLRANHKLQRDLEQKNTHLPKMGVTESESTTPEFFEERLRIVEKQIKILEHQGYMIRRKLIRMWNDGIVCSSRPDCPCFAIVPHKTFLPAFEKKFYFINAGSTAKYSDYIKNISARIKQIEAQYQRFRSERNAIKHKLMGNALIHKT